MNKRFLLYLQEFLAPLWAYKGMTFARISISLYASVAFVANAEIFRRFIAAIEAGNGKEVALKYALISATITLSAFVLNTVTYRWYWSHLYANYWRYITGKYLRRYLLLDNEDTAKLGTGNAVSIIERAFDGLLDSLTEHGVDLFDKTMRYILGICLVAYLNPSLVLPLIIATAFFWAFANWVNRKILVLRMDRNEAEMNILARIVRIIMEKFTIMKNGKIDAEINAMEPLFAKWEHLGLKVDRFFVWMDYFPQFIIDIGRVTVLVIMTMQMGVGTSIADFTAVLLITGFLSEYTFAIVRGYLNISREATYVWWLFALFDSIPTIEWYDSWEEFIFQKGEISIKNVAFSYKRSKPILKDFSLQIAWGKKIAFVGKSGAGKTTIVKLILGFVRPSSGNILIDGQDLRSISLKSYYRHIGYLPQEPAVFDGTVYENLTYGLPDGKKATDEEIERAIQLAQCEFIDRMSEWLQTEIGEKGIRLSGWERQRLAIARLFLQNPKIVILDEPTAALDSFSEMKISEALNTLCKGRTFIVIAHRLQTVKEADEIIVLQDGVIQERWTHEVLAKKDGIYAEMVRLQSGIRK